MDSARHDIKLQIINPRLSSRMASAYCMASIVHQYSAGTARGVPYGVMRFHRGHRVPTHSVPRHMMPRQTAGECAWVHRHTMSKQTETSEVAAGVRGCTGTLWTNTQKGRCGERVQEHRQTTSKGTLRNEDAAMRCTMGKQSESRERRVCHGCTGTL